MEAPRENQLGGGIRLSSNQTTIGHPVQSRARQFAVSLCPANKTRSKAEVLHLARSGFSCPAVHLKTNRLKSPRKVCDFQAKRSFLIDIGKKYKQLFEKRIKILIWLTAINLFASACLLFAFQALNTYPSSSYALNFIVARNTSESTGKSHHPTPGIYSTGPEIKETFSSSKFLVCIALAACLLILFLFEVYKVKWNGQRELKCVPKVKYNDTPLVLNKRPSRKKRYHKLLLHELELELSKQRKIADDLQAMNHSVPSGMKHFIKTSKIRCTSANAITPVSLQTGATGRSVRTIHNSHANDTCANPNPTIPQTPDHHSSINITNTKSKDKGSTQSVHNTQINDISAQSSHNTITTLYTRSSNTEAKRFQLPDNWNCYCISQTDGEGGEKIINYHILDNSMWNTIRTNHVQNRPSAAVPYDYRNAVPIIAAVPLLTYVAVCVLKILQTYSILHK